MGENSFVPKEELAPLSQEDKRQIGIRNRRKKTLFFLTEYPLSSERVGSCSEGEWRPGGQRCEERRDHLE